MNLKRRGDNIKTKITFLGIIFIIFIIASISVVSAKSISMDGNSLIHSDDESIVSISLNDAIILPKEGDNVFKINKKSSFKAAINKNAGPTIRLRSAEWEFSDGTKKRGIDVSHTFKRPGVYTIKLTINATGNEPSRDLGGYNVTQWRDCTKIYKVYVEEKANLAVRGLTRFNDRKGNVVALKIVVRNIGVLDAKASHLRIFYGPNKNLAINKNINKLAKTVRVKSLKAGKSVSIYVKFSVPKKYRNLPKFVRLDSRNVISQFNTENNLISFT
ncbi:MAG: PKD domain-containing protein [Methanobrevibacter sp.]|nr:PKD domain-containing protein [Methanobrevibacter sp.]